MITRFNDWFAIQITKYVGSMWCAYAFALLALVSFPEAIAGGISTTISWIAQTFLQLVLLSIIMVGQKLDGYSSEQRAIESHNGIMEALEILHESHSTTHAALEEIKGAVS